MKNEDLNPETQEKLLQLQKYQEQQLRDPVPQTSVPASPARKRPYEPDSLAEFEPPKKSTERDNSGYFYVSLIKALRNFVIQLPILPIFSVYHHLYEHFIL